MIDLTPVCNAVIALAALFTAFAIPWVKEHTTQKQREKLLAWVDITVAASQQLYYQLSGEERKDYVLDFLKEKGYKIDTLEVDNAIEAAVLKLHQQLGPQNVKNSGENVYFTMKNVEIGNT